MANGTNETETVNIVLETLESVGNIRKALTDIDNLAESMSLMGLLVPVDVFHKDGKNYLWNGHRRVAAAKALGWDTIRANVSPLPENPADILVLQLTTGTGVTFDPIEEAEAFQRLIDQGQTQTEIAAKIGKTQALVSQRLGLLKLPRSVSQQIKDGKLSATAAVILKNKPELLKDASGKSMREVRRIAGVRSEPEPAEIKTPEKEPEADKRQLIYTLLSTSLAAYNVPDDTLSELSKRLATIATL